MEQKERVKRHVRNVALNYTLDTSLWFLYLMDTFYIKVIQALTCALLLQYVLYVLLMLASKLTAVLLYHVVFPSASNDTSPLGSDTRDQRILWNSPSPTVAALTPLCQQYSILIIYHIQQPKCCCAVGKQVKHKYRKKNTLTVNIQLCPALIRGSQQTQLEFEGLHVERLMDGTDVTETLMVAADVQSWKI